MKFTTEIKDYFGFKFYDAKRATGFYLAMLTRDAHYALKGIQGDPNYQNYVDAYVQWFKLKNEGKPKNWADKTGTDKWYEDDWFMMENIDFYKNIYKNKDVLGNEKLNFTKVPTREVFQKYLYYLGLPTAFAQQEYRFNNKDLDDWGQIALGWVDIDEQKRRKELTPFERGAEEIAAQEAEWNRQLEEIERILAGIK